MDALSLSRDAAAQIDAWLEAKFGRTGSRHTQRMYQQRAASWLQWLQEHNLTLWSDHRRLAVALQAWADQGSSSAATYNHKVECINSLYTYLERLGVVSGNPSDLVERRKIHACRRAADHVISFEQLRACLAAIDQTTIKGARDYALLRVMLTTGRRLAEVAGLRCGDLSLQSDGKALLHWRRTKGGKSAHNLLPRRDAAPLIAWLQRWYQTPLNSVAKDAAVWVALTGATRGQALSERAIAVIVQSRLRTHPHALRALFAQTMERGGASLREIQSALGHSSATTTERYLAALRFAENPYAAYIDALFFGGDNGAPLSGD